MDRLPEQQSPVIDAFNIAFESNDADGLLTILASPEGGAVPRTMARHPFRPKAAANVACLRVLHAYGFELDRLTWVVAARYGRTDCLDFAVSHGYELGDRVLASAVLAGHSACVELVLQQGLPQQNYTLSMPPIGPEHLKCIQVMLDKKVAIEPQTLVSAAENGDVDLVRWLHERGLPLWQYTRDGHTWRYRNGRPSVTVGWSVEGPELPRVLIIPRDPRALEDMWKALRYGALFGAPVPRGWWRCLRRCGSGRMRCSTASKLPLNSGRALGCAAPRSPRALPKRCAPGLEWPCCPQPSLRRSSSWQTWRSESP